MLDTSVLHCAQMLQFLNYHPETHSRVMKDARRAYVIVSLFNSTQSVFFGTKDGIKYKDSKLFDQEERCKHIPDRRSSTSCKYRDDSFYKQLEDAQDRPSKHRQEYTEWDNCIRPIIAHCKFLTCFFKTETDDSCNQFSKRV